MNEQLNGAALNRAIAEALGYSIDKVTWTPASSADEGWMYVLRSPNGVSAAFGSTDFDKAWNIPANDGRDVSVSKFDTDANAVIAVLGKTHHVEFMEIDAETGEFLVCLAWLSDPAAMGYSMHYGRSSVSYQEAFARALLVALTANGS